MLRHTTRLPTRLALKPADSFLLCVCSITKIRSAHSMSSTDKGVSASWLRPADAHSIPGCSANTCSAVGLRHRFLPQIKRTLLMPQSYLTPDLTCCRRQSRGRKYEWVKACLCKEQDLIPCFYFTSFSNIYGLPMALHANASETKHQPQRPIEHL